MTKRGKHKETGCFSPRWSFNSLQTANTIENGLKKKKHTLVVTFLLNFSESGAELNIDEEVFVIWQLVS